MLNALLIQLMILVQPGCGGMAPVTLGQSGEIQLREHLLRLDTGGETLSVEQVATIQDCVVGSTRSSPVGSLLGPVPSTWYQFRISPSGRPLTEWALRVPARGLPDVCVSWPIASGFETRCEGRGNSPAYGAHYLFQLPAAMQWSRPVLLHLVGGMVAVGPISLVHQDWHMRQEHQQLLGSGIFIGLLLAISLLSLAAFASQGRRANLYYSGFLLFTGLSLAGFLGRGLQAFGLNSAWFATSGSPIFASAAIILLIVFSRSYLGLRDRGHRIWNSLFMASVALNVLVVLMAFGNPSAAIQLLPISALASILILLLVTTALALVRSARGRCLLASLGLLAPGILLASLSVLLDSRETLQWTTPLVLAGMVLMPTILVFGLYREYRLVAADRDQARGALAAEQRLALLRTTYCRITGLPRRTRTGQLFSRMTQNGSNEHLRLGVYLLHIDNLAEVRQRYGRAILEQVVTTLARRMRQETDEGQLLGRLDNWELVVVVPTGTAGDSFRSRLYEAAENISHCIQRPMEAGGHAITLSLSVGLAIWPLHGKSFDELLRRCDSALYEAQAAGGNRFTVFSEKAHAARSDHFQRISDLREALDQGQLELFYQPMHDAGSGEIVGMEALIRWHHPDHGLICPAEFIQLAEESEMILEMGYWVLETVIDQLAWLREQKIDHLPIALNVSPKQFSDRAFAQHIQYCLEQSAIDPNVLHLEITEDSLVEDFDQTRESLDLLQSLGVKIYVDDFGVGYSSLNYVRSLPIDGLKIDKSFVDKIGRSPQDEAVVATIVKLALGLDLNIVAEGVETVYQRDFLKRLGCSCLQGYLYSEPIPRALLIDYLDNCLLGAAAG